MAGDPPAASSVVAGSTSPTVMDGSNRGVPPNALSAACLSSGAVQRRGRAKTSCYLFAAS
jgi:hypothetical protein